MLDELDEETQTHVFRTRNFGLSDFRNVKLCGKTSGDILRKVLSEITLKKRNRICVVVTEEFYSTAMNIIMDCFAVSGDISILVEDMKKSKKKIHLSRRV